LYGLHLDLFKNVSAAQSFADYLVYGVLHQGNGFLKLHRSLLIQGVRLLGLEEPSFSDSFDFRGKKYPYPYNLIFQELETLGKGAIIPGLVPDSVKRMAVPGVVVNHSHTSKTRGRVQSLLTLLNWPKYIKLGISVDKKTEILQDFKNKINDILDPTVSSRSVSVLSEQLCHSLFSLPRLSALEYEDRLQLDPSYRTYKGRRDIPGKLPSVLIEMVGGNRFYSDEGVQGTATVLSEAGGKSRIILGYNGLLNSTDFYLRVRRVLDLLPEDCSRNQSRGHKYVRQHTRRDQWYITDAPVHISADLDAFTDNLSMLAVMPYLKRLNATDFQTIASSPVEVDGEEVYPVKFLMGLKGTFEVASVVHHGIARHITSEYVMCGDDLFMVGSSNQQTWAEYQRLCSEVGLKVNNLKTVCSPIVGVFCGEVYWDGEEVSPLRIPMYTLRENLHDRRSLSRAAGSIISRSYSLPTSFRKVFQGFVVRMLSSRKCFHGTLIPKELPEKLGGLGLRYSRGLLSVLSRPAMRSFVLFSECREAKELITRRYVPFVGKAEVPRFPWCINLLVSGGYTRPRKSRLVEPNWTLKEIVPCLEYFYSS
jgi:hypothetical protein